MSSEETRSKQSNSDGMQTKVPRRPFGVIVKKETLPSTLPIIGLGCSSYSTAYWSTEEKQKYLSSSSEWAKPENIEKIHPRVQEWIQTIHFAIKTCGITILDTAPWYGHGTSEIVIGWAIEDLLLFDADSKISREDLVINTKVGRYEADPRKQFDFSRTKTLGSVQQSLRRLKCTYIDVLQLHDPEFAPSLEQLMEETIPAMIKCRSEGLCRALGMTGYPLEVQFQILQRTLDEDFAEVDSKSVWDQSLTYGHFNLHDKSIFSIPLVDKSSFADYCQNCSIGLLAAAPLSMGLLTHNDPPSWHPAMDTDLAAACVKAASICDEHQVNISTLAIVVAVSDPRIACTFLGMKNITEVKFAASLANRFHKINNGNDRLRTEDDMLKQVLTIDEFKAWTIISDPVDGPFASVWKNGNYIWDGVQCARDFWNKKELEGVDTDDWQAIPSDKSFSLEKS